MARERVPIAFNRSDRWLIALILLLVGTAVAVVSLSEPMVAPPRPKVSDEKHAAIGMVVRSRSPMVVAAQVWGPARDAGMRVGDRIVSIDGRAIRQVDDFNSAVRAAKEGDILRVEARRGAEADAETPVLASVKVVLAAISPADVGLIYEDVAFRNADGLTLRGWYLPPPAEGPGRAPAITYGHGNASDRRDWLPVATAVHDAGFAQLLFDFTGRGESDGEVITLGAHESGDLRSALDVLTARPEVDPLRLAVGGRSMGAVAALYLGQDDARVKALVLDSPFADLASVVDRVVGAYHLPASLLRPLLFEIAGWRAHYTPGAIKPVEAIAKVKAPILLFHGSEDELVPFDDALKLKAAARAPLTFVPLPGLSHNSPRPPSYGERIARFLTDTLPSPRRTP